MPIWPSSFVREESSEPDFPGVFIDLVRFGRVFGSSAFWGSGNPYAHPCACHKWEKGPIVEENGLIDGLRSRRAEGEIARLEPDALVLSGARIPMDNVDRQLDEWLKGLEEEI